MFEFLTGQRYTSLYSPGEQELNPYSTPTDWEMELTDYLGSKISEVINTGTPADWPRYTVTNPDQISIRNDDVSIIASVEDGTELYRSQYAIDHFIEMSEVVSSTVEATTSSTVLLCETVSAIIVSVLLCL